MNKLILALLFLIGCGKPILDEKDPASYKSSIMKGVSGELILNMNMSLNFDLLPLKGEVRAKEKFWSGDSWKLGRGAINYRWNSPLKEGFNYLSPTTREIFSMPKEKFRNLSPAEKYDLYMGRYDYPLKNEVYGLAYKSAQSWEGLCHGWAGASLNHSEPQPRMMENPDGLEIPFGSSDIKALLTYAYSKVLIGDKESLGKRCESISWAEKDLCEDDLDALSFHAVLSNKLGLRGESFIADVDRFKEVWNHPITNYETKIIKMRGTITGRIVEVVTRITYIDVVENNSWDTIRRISSYLTVRYQLILDREGNMVNSQWLSQERPDFLWTIKKQEYFEGYLSGLKNLLK